MTKQIEIGPTDSDRPSDIEMQPVQDPKERKELRSSYRNILEDIKENQDEYCQPESDGAANKLEEINTVFSRVQMPREAAMDSQALVAIGELGRQKAQALHTDFVVFQPTEFADKLINYISNQNVSDSSHNIGRVGWEALGAGVAGYYKRSPSLHYMFGSFKREPVCKAPARSRVKEKESEKVKGPTAPKDLRSFKDADKREATTEEVEKILELLQTRYEEGEKQPMCYFEFVINPFSFGQTVENIFYTSFLIRDGHARIFLDDDKLPVIEPVERGNDDPDATQLPRHQVVATLSKQEWKDLVDKFHLREPTIPTRDPVVMVENDSKPNITNIQSKPKTKVQSTLAAAAAKITRTPGVKSVTLQNEDDEVPIKKGKKR